MKLRLKHSPDSRRQQRAAVAGVVVPESSLSLGKQRGLEVILDSYLFAIITSVAMTQLVLVSGAPDRAEVYRRRVNTVVYCLFIFLYLFLEDRARQLTQFIKCIT